MADASRLPRWQSHKIVHAAKIVSLEPGPAHAGAPERLRLLIPGKTPQEENGSIVVEAAENMFARYRPVSGDYYVVYEDGYASISPRQAFEDGYHPL